MLKKDKSATTWVRTYNIATAKNALSGVTLFPNNPYVKMVKKGTKVKFEVNTPKNENYITNK